ncbi:MAG: site-2 protease family protein, partial [Nitrososphaerota archaeon]|nr:site-2 protease family protein [Nitrososphaerota archaeon]
VAIAAFFIPFAFSGNYYMEAIGSYGSYINLFLALFNLLPLGPLDGAKVWRWNLFLWGVVFVPLALVLAFFFGLI